VLARTDFKFKYAGSVLGYFWSVAKPLLYFTVLWIVFRSIFKASLHNYPLYLILGIVLWTFVADAARTSFGRFVTMPYKGHLQPGQFAIAWLVSRIAPLNYTVAVFPVLLLTLAGGVLMWKFLVALFGDRPATLIPLAFLMLCPLTVPAALCSSGAERAASAERSEWTAGHGPSLTPGSRSAASCRSARCCA